MCSWLSLWWLSLTSLRNKEPVVDDGHNHTAPCWRLCTGRRTSVCLRDLHTLWAQSSVCSRVRPELQKEFLEIVFKVQTLTWWWLKLCGEREECVCTYDWMRACRPLPERWRQLVLFAPVWKQRDRRPLLVIKESTCCGVCVSLLRHGRCCIFSTT